MCYELDLFVIVCLPLWSSPSFDDAAAAATAAAAVAATVVVTIVIFPCDFFFFVSCAVFRLSLIVCIFVRISVSNRYIYEKKDSQYIQLPKKKNCELIKLANDQLLVCIWCDIVIVTHCMVTNCSNNKQETSKAKQKKKIPTVYK